MAVLVTGAKGFLGRKVVGALLAQGNEVRCLVHTPGAEAVLNTDKVDVHYGSVTDPSSLKAALYDVDAVVHLVAIIREKGGATFRGINVQGVENIVQAASASGVKRIVHVSAIGAQDNPQLPYLHSKWLGEQAVIQSEIPYAILRPSLVFGEGDGFINTLAGLVKALPVVPIAGSGNNEFQPIAVDDAARCVAAAVDRDDLVSRTIEIGGPERLTYSRIVDIIAETLAVRRLKVRVSLSLMSPMVRLMELLLPRPPVTMHQLAMLPVPNYAEIGAVETVFGFKPKPLDGNIDFVNKVRFRDGMRIVLGFMPRHIRDH